MTKSTQQLADEMVRKAVMVHLPEHPANQLAMFNAIKESIPLLELLELARAVKPSLEGIPDEDLFPEQRALLNALANLQKKVEL